MSEPAKSEPNAELDLLNSAEPAISRSSIDLAFEDAKIIVVVGFIAFLMAVGLLFLFGTGIAEEATPRFSFTLAAVLLFIPPGTYIFSFWAYRQMLFNEQLREAINLFGANPEFRNRIIERIKAGRSNKKKRPTQKDASEEIREQLNYEASKTLMSVYGLSLSAYFPVLVILELIVVLGFVLPICELLSTGYIGVLSLTLWPGSVSISSWIVECAFFGAFVHSFFNILDRVPRKDIQPNFYLNILIRYIISVALAMLFYLVFDLFGVNPSNNAIPMALLAGIAFIIGMFPNIFLREIETAISRRINVTLSSDVPLANLPGISRMEASRLWEEGMHNISQLADSDVAELHKRTHFDCTRLSTIIGSAILWRVIGGDKSVQQTGSKQSNSKPDKKKTTASAASEENETKKPTESTSASGESTPAKTQKGETRVEILRSLGINTLQDLYWFVFEKQAPTESVLASDKRLELLTSSLGLEKEFVINAAKSFVRFQGQLEVPPSAVETVVMSR